MSSRPSPGETICDPACGTGGFLLAAHDYIVRHHPNLDQDQKRHLQESSLPRLSRFVDNAARLCAMNLLLHGIGGDEADPLVVADALAGDPGERFDMVLTNPPFGKKFSVDRRQRGRRSARETVIIVRDDFWATTSNKQLNFLQHVKTLLKLNGRAAVVVPDNVLFEGGAGETVRRKLLHECDVHTLLRLPDRHLLRPGRQGERPVLRPEAGQRNAVDEEALDLRPPDQQALHAEDQSAQARRPRRVRCVLQPENRHSATRPGPTKIPTAAGEPTPTTS